MAMLPKRIADFLDARRPQALCDRCIAGELGERPARVRAVTEAFAVTNDFTRVPASCGECGEQDWAIRAGGTQ